VFFLPFYPNFLISLTKLDIFSSLFFKFFFEVFIVILEVSSRLKELSFIKNFLTPFIVKPFSLSKYLDKLDNSFIKLVKERTEIVKQVLKLKENKSQIVDKKRIKYILNQIRKKSIKKKIDPRITNRIWKNMISSYIDYEKRNFKKK
jgi:chorismate mutase